MSDSLRPHGLQHTRSPCPSPTPGTYSNSCPSRWWCHPTILSSVVPFSSSLPSFPASGSFPMSRFFASGSQILEHQLRRQSFQWLRVRGLTRKCPHPVLGFLAGRGLGPVCSPTPGRDEEWPSTGCTSRIPNITWRGLDQSRAVQLPKGRERPMREA